MKTVQVGKNCFGDKRHQVAKEMYDLLYKEKSVTTCKKCGSEIEVPHTTPKIAKLFGVSVKTVNDMVEDYSSNLHRSQDPKTQL